MAAPALTYSVTGKRVSPVEPFEKVIVTFTSDAPYEAFECRATKAGEPFGRGKGALLASFSQTPADTPRQFELYNSFLLAGDGDYRISLFAQGEDGSWNDNEGFRLADDSKLILADGKEFLCMR